MQKTESLLEILINGTFVSHPWRLFGSTTRLTRVSLTDMRNINNPALQAERFVLLSEKSNLFYQGHTVLRSRTVRCQ